MKKTLTTLIIFLISLALFSQNNPTFDTTKFVGKTGPRGKIWECIKYEDGTIKINGVLLSPGSSLWKTIGSQFISPNPESKIIKYPGIPIYNGSYNPGSYRPVYYNTITDELGTVTGTSGGGGTDPLENADTITGCGGVYAINRPNEEVVINIDSIVNICGCFVVKNIGINSSVTITSIEGLPFDSAETTITIVYNEWANICPDSIFFVTFGNNEITSADLWKWKDKTVQPLSDTTSIVIKGGTFIAPGDGDVDDNGILDNTDVIKINRHLAQLSNALTDKGKANADLNGDGKITAGDVDILRLRIINLGGNESDVQYNLERTLFPYSYGRVQLSNTVYDFPIDRNNGYDVEAGGSLRIPNDKYLYFGGTPNQGTVVGINKSGEGELTINAAAVVFPNLQTGKKSKQLYIDPVTMKISYGDSSNITALYEPKIGLGTTNQYWRGDKSWQTLPTYTPSQWTTAAPGIYYNGTVTIGQPPSNLSAILQLKTEGSDQSAKVTFASEGDRGWIGYDGSYGFFGIGSPAGTNITIAPNGVKIFHVEQDKVVIGDYYTSPVLQLGGSQADNAKSINFMSDNSQTASITQDDGQGIFTINAGAKQFTRGDQIDLYIDGVNGNVGVGSEVANYKLTVNGDAGVSGKIFASGLSTVTTTPNLIGIDENGEFKKVPFATGNGTVTSIATGYGLSGGTITTSGTLIADTNNLLSKTKAAMLYENKIGVGTTNQYWNGSKQWVNFPSIPAAQIQSDWDQTNSGSLDYIKNKPIIPAGTVTGVTATAPVVSSGGTAPVISMAAATGSVNGYLTSTDWNTFNSKGSGTVTGVSATTPLSSTGGNTPTIAIKPDTLTAWYTKMNKGVVAYNWGNHAIAGYAATSHLHTGVYEPTITPGTTSQYYRGDKTWQTFPTITNGTVTSVATGYGLSGGTITTSGTLRADTNYLLSKTKAAMLYENKIGIGTSNQYLNGSKQWVNFPSIPGGTVTGVTATAPVLSSGGTAPVISMAAATGSVDGYLTYTDWNTFNNKGSKWTSVVGNDDIYRLTGNVGIGDDTPTRKLDVVGGLYGIYGEGTTYGIQGYSASVDANGGVGVRGSGDKKGVYGFGGEYGVYGSGTGVGVYGTATNAGGAGIKGTSSLVSGYGGFFDNSAGGVGVYASSINIASDRLKVGNYYVTVSDNCSIPSTVSGSKWTAGTGDNIYRSTGLVSIGTSNIPWDYSTNMDLGVKGSMSLGDTLFYENGGGAWLAAVDESLKTNYSMHIGGDLTVGNRAVSIDYMGMSPWVKFTCSYGTATIATLSGNQLMADRMYGSLIRWESSAGAIRYGCILSTGHDAGSITLVVYGTSSLASGDKNFYYSPFLKAKEYERQITIPGEVIADANAPQGTWFQGMPYDTLAIFNVSAWVLTAASGTGAALTYNLLHGSTKLFTDDLSMGTNTSLLCKTPTAVTIVPPSVNMTLRIYSSAGATTKASDFQCRFIAVPTRIFWGL